MRIFTIKNILLSVVCLSAIEYTGVVLAHTQIGSLGAAVSATDVYQVTCSSFGTTLTDHLEAAIEDNLPVNPALLSLVVYRGGAITSTDNSTTDGDLIYSPFVRMGGGNGVYTVLVNKTAANVENYVLAYHCKDVTNNIHTGTLIKVIQNQ